MDDSNIEKKIVDSKIEIISISVNEIELEDCNNKEKSKKLDSNNWPMIALSFGMISHSICFTSPLPYVSYMMVDFKMSKDLDSSGYAAGWIIGIFMLGRFFSGILWGLAADKYGRRYCILLSLFNIGFFMLLFGFSSNFEMALIVRFCLGLGNGFMGICKTSITEISINKIKEIKAFGIINGMWGLGLIIGPTFGGIFSRPAILYPSFISKNSLLGVYPYLLPSILCFIIATISFILTYKFLPETGGTEFNYNMIKESKIKNQKKKIIYKDNDNLRIRNNSNNKRKLTCKKPYEYDFINSPTRNKFITNGDIDIENEIELLMNDKNDYVIDILDDKNTSDNFLEMLYNKEILYFLILYMMHTFVCVIVNELYPLWTVTSENNGGLGETSFEVGEILAIVGFVLLIFQLFFYENILKIFCVTNSRNIIFRFEIFAAITVVLIPFSIVIINLLVDKDSLNYQLIKNISLITILSLFRFTSTSVYTTMGVAINSSVKSSNRATINGLVIMFGSLGNCLGPIVGSISFAYLTENKYLNIDGRLLYIIAAFSLLLLSTIIKIYGLGQGEFEINSINEKNELK